MKVCTSFNYFRSISLCNVVYKIISKILVARLRPLLHKLVPLLHKLVPPCQFAFVPGRWIAENEVIVQEMLHSFKLRKVKDGQMVVKLDLQKTYDRVNWAFLQGVLRKFSLVDTFVNWIIECVSTVYSSLLINGGKTRSFKPKRGLR